MTRFAKARAFLYYSADADLSLRMQILVMQMQQLAKPKMTVDEFLAWAEENPGRYELSEGEVYAMSAERLEHALAKFAMQSALLAAIRKAGLPCHMVPDGATVRVSKQTAYEPDALVYCGPEKPGSAIEVPDPVIVVEVLSPGTRHIDNAAKLPGYFALPSVCHYLIVDIEKRLILHHARGEGDLLTTRIVRDGALTLDPPGLALDFASCFQAG
jgi:Uma2 family endonuclease